VPAEIEPERTEPYPIGKVCAHYRERIADADGGPLAADAEGELCIAGPGVMQGYWNRPELDERVFVDDREGTRWYRTGDIVHRDENGDFRFLGRRDRMIKKRGYRVELGEIEAALYRHPEVKEAAVVAVAADDGPRVTAFLSTKSGDRLSIIALKQFCLGQLPQYMTPDTFQFMATLPKTSTDKVDYQRLKEQV
jgi:acyl-CoA synthetase (AMP-forming)/AMP-acid ligase II